MQFFFIHNSESSKNVGFSLVFLCLFLHLKKSSLSVPIWICLVSFEFFVFCWFLPIYRYIAPIFTESEMKKKKINKEKIFDVCWIEITMAHHVSSSLHAPITMRAHCDDCNYGALLILNFFFFHFIFFHIISIGIDDCMVFQLVRFDIIYFLSILANNWFVFVLHSKLWNWSLAQFSKKSIISAIRLMWMVKPKDGDKNQKCLNLNIVIKSNF